MIFISLKYSFLADAKPGRKIKLLFGGDFLILLINYDEILFPHMITFRA